MLFVKIECAWNSLDKELTANCLVETRTKLEELIPAAMVKYGLNRVQLPLRLKQCLINGFSWYSLSQGHSGQRTSVKCAEATWNYKAGGIVHLKSPAIFFVRFVHTPVMLQPMTCSCSHTNNFHTASCSHTNNFHTASCN